MKTVAGFGLKQLNWRNASQEEVSRLVSAETGRVNRHRGAEIRSDRGFGYRRHRNEVAPNLTSYRDGWYYDSFTVAAGASFPTTQMFATAQGAGGKTLAQTNLTGQGGATSRGSNAADAVHPLLHRQYDQPCRFSKHPDELFGRVQG